MITIEQINNIVTSYAKVLKSSKTFDPAAMFVEKMSNEKLQKLRKDEINDLPELWTGYRFAVRQMRDIQTHTQRDIFPKHLFLDMGPHAKDRDIEFARLNFKAITLPVWIDMLNTVMRAFQDGNWHIDYNDQEDYQKYVEDELPIYGSLESFIKGVLTPIKLQDPNGIIAVKPYQINYFDNGEELVISDELLEPFPVYYSSKRILAQKENQYFAVLSGEKVKLEDGDGIVIEIYDENAIYRVEQKGRKAKYEFSEPVVWFEHNLGMIPVFKLKGVPVLNIEALEEIGLLYNSPFAYAVDNLDKVLTDDATLEIVKKKCAFPYMVAVGLPCEFELNGSKCNNGKIWDNEKSGEITCPHCLGSGMLNRLSPSGELLINPGGSSLTDLGDTNLKGDYIKFVAPDTAIFDFLESQKKDNENRARRILHIKDVDGQYVYSADKTATGSDNDMKAMYAFIQPISDQIFTLYKDVADAIGVIRYGEAYEPVKLIAPQSFDLSSSSDYLEIINQLTSAGASPTVLREFIHKYLKSMHYSDTRSAQILEIIMQADALMPFDSETIAAKVERGINEKWQEILHDSATLLIDELIVENPNYLDLDLSEQVRLLEDKAKSKVPVTSNDLATQLLNGLGG